MPLLDASPNDPLPLFQLASHLSVSWVRMLGSRSPSSLLASALILGPSLSLGSVSSSWVLEHLGNLSPYQKAPVPSGLQESLPSDCKVDQVFYVRISDVATISLLTYFSDRTTWFPLPSRWRTSFHPRAFSETCGSFNLHPKGAFSRRARFLKVWLQHHSWT
jgi:hypothetical protein